MIDLRPLLLGEAGGRTHRDGMGRSGKIVRHCEADGCERSTREGKPFCPEHLFESAYARRVHEEAARRGYAVG